MMVLSTKKSDINIEKLIYLSIRLYLLLILNMPKLTKVSKVSKVELSESESEDSETEVMSGGEEKKVVHKSETESESDTDSDTSDDEQAGGAKKKAVKKTPVKKAPVKKAKEEETKPKAKKSAKSQKETDDEKPAKKPARSRKPKEDDGKPKKELNPIMKEMNKFRNEVIGAHLGTKSPMKTIPPFKVAMAEARKQLKMGEKDKNTVDVVKKATELFKGNPAKYCD
jgi:hypothetical protein